MMFVRSINLSKNKNPGLLADVKAFSYPNIVSFDAVKIGRNELFVMVFSFTVCGEKNQRTKCLKNINVLTI